MVGSLSPTERCLFDALGQDHLAFPSVEYYCHVVHVYRLYKAYEWRENEIML